jgi:hypothetical protein
MLDARPSKVLGANDGGSELISPAPFRFSLRVLLSGMGVFACSAGALAWLHKLELESERQQRLQRLEKLIPACMEQVGSGMHAYGGVHLFDNAGIRKDRSWPPDAPLDGAGQPIRSWRMNIGAHIVCCLDSRAPDLEQPWNAPVNRAYVQSDGNAFTLTIDRTYAHVFGITGPGSAFDPDSVPHYYELPDYVIVAIECRDSKVEAMEPGDYDVTELLSRTGRVGDHLHGFIPGRLHVMFADGKVWALSPDAPITLLHPFLTIDGAKTHDRHEVLAPYRVD